MTSSSIKLLLCNWGLVSEETLELAQVLASRKILSLEKSLYQLVIRGLTPNPHQTQYGKAALIGLALERVLFLCSGDAAQPSLAELKRALTLLPEARRYYRLIVKGGKWSLTFRSGKKRIRYPDWQQRDWALIFDVAGTFHFFKVKGQDFHVLMSLLGRLNGECSLAMLQAEFSESKALLNSFLSFARRVKLLTKVRKRRPQTAQGNSVRLISHSCVWIESQMRKLLIDPVFFMQRPYNTKPGRFKLMNETVEALSSLDAIFITHAHWDHLHIATVARIPRTTPVFVPLVKNPTDFNPSVADFFMSLGFLKVVEVAHWQSVDLDGIKVIAVPFRGEFFSPGSSFEANTYLIDTGGYKIYGTVDTFRDENGHMDSVIQKLRRRVGRVDCVLFGSLSGMHAYPSFCGGPQVYSNDFKQFEGRMQFLPDHETIRGWLETLRPRYAIPYAAFVFFTARKKRLTLHAPSERKTDHLFASYWRECLGVAERKRLQSWRHDMSLLHARLRKKDIRLLMLGTGDRLEL